MKKKTPTKPPTDQYPNTEDPRQQAIGFLVEAMMEMVEERVKAKRLARIQSEITHKTESHE